MTNAMEADLAGLGLPFWPEEAAPAWLRNVFATGHRFGAESAETAAGTAMTDAQEFESFMRSYQNMVFSAAMRLLANQAEAEDVTQEVFLKAYERFPELRHNPRVAGWLRTVAVNLSLNHLSRYRARWTFFSELFRSEESGPEWEAPSAQDVGEDVSAADRRQLVEEALRRLPTAQRVPLALFHMEGLRYEEIAAKLGVSLGKVKTDIFRGREAMRKRLESRLKDDLGLTQ